jgi:hypothetical protein
MSDDSLKRLDQAIAKRKRTEAADKAALENLRQVIRDIADDVPQVELVKHTGWSREYIRKIVKRS